MKDSDCAIIVMSCDKYSDLWHDFFNLKSINWPRCRLNCYLVTNNKHCKENNVIDILCEDYLNWTGRLKKCLLAIPEKYVILMLEDYYISEEVDNIKVKDLLSLIEKDHISYCKVEERNCSTKKLYKNIEYLRIITPDIHYGISLTTSIWEKGFLLEVIGDNDYTAWEFEIDRNRESSEQKEFSKLCICDIRNILNIKHMVQRGKYIGESLKYFQKKGYYIDKRKRGVINPINYFIIKFSSIQKSNPRIYKLLLRILKILHIKTISQKYEDEIKRGLRK